MHVVRGADVHGVDLVHLEQLAVVGELVPDAELRRHLVEDVFLNVTYGDYFSVRIL